MTQKRLLPRAPVMTLPPAFRPMIELWGQTYPIRNVSEGGIGIWMPVQPSQKFKNRTETDATISVGETAYLVRIKLAHYSNRVLGAQVLNVPPELRKTFEYWLAPAREAHNLVMREGSGEVDHGLGYPRLWMTGPTGSELIVWYNESSFMILALQVVFQSTWVYRRQFHPAESGELPRTSRIPLGIKVEEELLSRRDLSADGDALQQTAVFLGAVPPPTPGNLLWQFLESGEQVFLPAEIFRSLKVA